MIKLRDLSYVNKKFKIRMPLQKGYDGGDGFYYLEFALSTTDVDLENEQVTAECLDDMIEPGQKFKLFPMPPVRP